VRHSPQAPFIETLEKVADVIYEETPKIKQSLLEVGQQKISLPIQPTKIGREIQSLQAPLKEHIIKKCEERGVSRNYAFLALDLLLDLGMRHGVAVNGVPWLIELGRYEAVVRLMDVYGDPPFVRTVFNCPTCGREYTADNMLTSEQHYCLDCLTWFEYDGKEVKIVAPRTGYAHVNGFLIDKTGTPLSGIPIIIRKKVRSTDARGYFLLEYIPHGTYELEIQYSSQRLSLNIQVDESFRGPLKVVTAKCCQCGNVWFEGDIGSEYQCPKCHTKHFYSSKDGKIYKLAPNEAFCYDFNSNWATWWELSCPNCGSVASLEFSSGRWFCSHCGLYVEPKHDYRFFRCILPCGHEHVYSVHYLTDNIPLKCWTCNKETELPPHIHTAWKSFNFTLLDTLSKIVVQGEYFVRRNPWVLPVALIGGPLAVGFGLFLFGSDKSGK
jgi:ribosomal protein S27AE